MTAATNPRLLLFIFDMFVTYFFVSGQTINPRLYVLRPLTRSFYQQRKTRSTKSEPKTVTLDYEEIKVPGWAVDWRYDKKIVKEYRFPTVVRISRTKTKGKYYKSFHAAKTTPSGKMAGLYFGALVDKSRVLDGRWCVAVPGHRNEKCLDSKISKDWQSRWERYLHN
jgi:hypothetical protein